MPGYFITGTDTGVGKTWVTLALMKAMQNKGKVVVGMKPVACGCKETRDGLRHGDALSILKQSSRPVNYNTVNPYAFQHAIAPHIAAGLVGVMIDIEKIAGEFDKLIKDSDCVLVEGIGGWCVPLGGDIMLSELVNRLDLPVILVVGLRLGCINHALSTVRAIQADEVNLCGWMTSQLDPDYAFLEETMMTLQARISAPLLGNLPHMEKFDLEILASHTMMTECPG
ncbi:MAG: dethiobiotin synthase [Proteobacteria bacterium]|nr:dethiobiotin synthase [Pseudomonadota bacterium]